MIENTELSEIKNLLYSIEKLLKQASTLGVAVNFDEKELDNTVEKTVFNQDIEQKLSVPLADCGCKDVGPSSFKKIGNNSYQVRKI